MRHFCVIPKLCTIQLISFHLQTPDSSTVVKKYFFGEPRWSFRCPYGAPNRAKLLAPSSSTESSVSSLLHGCAHKAKDKSNQQSNWMLAIRGELLTLTVSPRNQASTTSNPSSLTEPLSLSLCRVVYKRRRTRATDNPPV